MVWHQDAGPLPTPPSQLLFTGGLLRPWQLNDAAVLVDAWADGDIARWNVVPADPTQATAERWIQGQQRRLAQQQAIDLVVEVPDQTGVATVVGEVGLSGFNATHRGALIGYWLLPAARGQGIATAAVSAFCDWAHRTLQLENIVARCHPANAASHAVAERAGFVHEANEPSGNQLWRSRTRDA